jgi:class 3 adenylate cyclase/tetratricopeptide (TPR) repeat protein
MKCPKCQFENREDAKFCNKCGHKFEHTCPNCGTANRAGAKFCDECGHNLTIPSEPPVKDLSFDEKLDKIQRYLPKGLTEKILSQRDKIEGEHKLVTVMFCDMEGFTILVDRLGPEEAYGTMDQIYEILIHKVHDYEGTVNEMTGDGILALFGAPIALEDAPQRAVRSAMAIHREMSRFSDRLKHEREYLPPLKMRVGIHTGPVVVGTVGNNLRVEFKAVGDTVNLASRMEGLAEPGTTYVTEDTFKLTEGLFMFEALGKREVKGKEEPVRVYRVIAPSTRRTRFDVSADRGLTPFVGRERELDLLLDGFDRFKAGRGQAFSIIAEAGLGKSRLLYEFRKAVTSEDVMFLEGRCLSYSGGVSYHPIIEILKANFDVRDGDGDAEIREKVKRGLKILGLDEASTLPYFLELLSVKDSGIDKIPMSPEAKKDRIMKALKQIVLKGSEIRPLILAYEDLHWMDKGSEEALKYVLESIPGARVLMIFTYRPEFVHTWGGKSFHSQITLNRLSNRESLIMISHLLGTEDIESDLEELILEKTEGVPFFIEEFIRSLKDLSVIKRRDSRYYLAKDIQDVAIPSTIQDVIMARVDSLPEGAKDVLQIGSVIEREFNYELIKRVTGLLEVELLSHLSVLKDSELLYERGIFPQSTYIFKHALTQEVVYDSILTRRKRELHDKIGQTIEELYKDNIDENYVILAEHFIISENYEKAAEYSRLAGRKAMMAAAWNDSIAYAKKSIASFERLPQTDGVQKKLIDARTTLGLYYIQMNYHVESKDAVDPIVDLAVEQNYKSRVAQIYTIMGTYEYFIREDYPEAFKYLEDALRISKELNDVLSLVMANYWIGLAHSLNCEFDKALYHMETALDINVSTNTLWGVSLLKSMIGSWVYRLKGNIDLYYQASDEALRIAEESGDIYSKAWAYMAHGDSFYHKGFIEEAERHLMKGVYLSEKINLFSAHGWSNWSLGDLYCEIGEHQKAKDHYCKAISSFEDRLIPSWVNLIRIALERAKVMNMEKDINLESLYGYEKENKMKIQDGLIQRYLAEILLNIEGENITKAEECIKKAIEADKRDGMMWHLGRDYAFYAELFKLKGDKTKVKENLAKAKDILKECGADGWVKIYEEKLASLS